MITKQTIKDVASGTVTYYGEADLGTSTWVKGWSILKSVVNGNVTTNYAPINSKGVVSGAEEFEWDERASYTYADAFAKVSTITLSTLTIASNNTTSTLAKVGDVVTLTIVSSANINTPIVTIGTRLATIVPGVDASHWTATRTMDAMDVNGVVPFSVAFTDASTGYPAASVSTKTGGSDVTFDNQVATLSTVTIASNNANTALAKTGDVITLTFVATESLKSKPTVTIATHTIDAADVTQGIDAKHWTAVYTMIAGDTTGNVPFSIDALDLAGNPIVQVTATTDSSAVTFDKTAPVFTGTSVLSNNADTSKAKSADTVTAIFTTDSVLAANPTVTLGTKAMTFGSKVGSTYTYTRVLDGSETEGTANCLVTGSDLAGNTTTNTNVGHVDTDFTAPTLVSVNVDDVTHLTVTLSELLKDTTITKENDGGFVVYETGTPATLYTVESIAPGVTDDLVTLTVADMTASAAVGVTVTYATGGNGTVQDIAGNLMVTDATGKNAATWA
jgi:large repetitive protein